MYFIVTEHITFLNKNMEQNPNHRKFIMIDNFDQ